MEYIKCDKCSEKVKTQEEFKNLLKVGTWFIGHDGWAWDYQHNCNK